MQKHLAFWIGFFLAAVCSVIIALGAWGVVTERALSVVAVAAGAIFALSLVLIVIFAFRDTIIRRTFGSAVTSLEELTQKFSQLASATIDKDSKRTADASSDMARGLLSWYAWVSSYRWIINTNIALLIVFGGFTGTVLLFEQNNRIREQTKQLVEQAILLRQQNDRMEVQNEIQLLSVVDELRTRMSSTARSRTEQFVVTAATGFGGLSSLDDFALDDQAETDDSVDKISGPSDVSPEAPCRVLVDGSGLSRLPNPSEIRAIAGLAQSEKIGPSIIGALASLLYDENSGVVLGSMIILDDLGLLQEASGGTVTLRDVFIGTLEVSSDVKIVFEESFVKDFTCLNCKVSAQGTYISVVDNMTFANIDRSVVEAGAPSYISTLENPLTRPDSIHLLPSSAKYNGDSLFNGYLLFNEWIPGKNLKRPSEGTSGACNGMLGIPCPPAMPEVATTVVAEWSGTVQKIDAKGRCEHLELISSESKVFSLIAD